jgi:nitrate/nitrite transporter NarK
VRTALLTSLALGTGWLGRRYGRRELVLLAYPLMAIAGVKLIAEDLQEGRSLIFVLSLLLFGAGLMILPGLLRKKPRVPAAGR